jgi:hypothetical protein
MAFNVPINSIAPIATPSDWVRPSDWITITDTANEVQFLVADTSAKAFAIQTTFTRTSGNIYIDWGDGTVDTISTITSTTTEHVYSTGGTPCYRGYNTFKIRIYGDATCVITNAKHLSNFTVTGGAIYYNVGLLEAYFGDNTCNTTELTGTYFSSAGGTTSVSTFELLEYVKLPSSVAWTTQMVAMFMNCGSLYKIVMPTSADSLTNLTSMCNSCTNLRDIVLPSNATTITNLTLTFNGCINLRTVLFPTTLNSCTTLLTAFQNCASLKNITLPSINLVVSLESAFGSCRSLQWVKFTSLPSPASPATAVNLTTAFNPSCTSLQNVYLPSTCSSNAVYNLTSTFNGVVNLKTITFPTNFNASALSSCFLGCESLTRVVFQSGMANLTVATSCFSGCYLLTSVTLPTTVGATIGMAGMFDSCYVLPSITIPSGWTITSLSTAFQNCINLKTIALPNNTQNSITSMASMCLGCNKLESITMPTSMTAATSLSTTFQNCLLLTSVAFPSTMNLVTTAANCFNTCESLSSVTMPTSMNGCTTFLNTFNGCWSLTSITMPATVSASLTTFASAFVQCVNLQTLTLPTTQTSALTTLTSIFAQCSNLTTINNLNKLGSLTATPLVSAGVITQANRLPSLSFSCPFSLLAINGTSATNFSRLNSLRLLNTGAGQWTGTSPQINVSYCDLDIAALNQLFTDLTTVTTKTINITGCTGVAGCTKTIATNKGWTVTF